MTSGLAWDEGLGTVRPLTELTRNRDWVRFILDRPMANQPGEMFYYNSGNSHLLSALITRLTGQSAEDFAKARLFGPLGITDYVWPKDPQGQSYGGWGLSLFDILLSRCLCSSSRHLRLPPKGRAARAATSCCGATAGMTTRRRSMPGCAATTSTGP